jgi:hypothetical protein
MEKLWEVFSKTPVILMLFHGVVRKAHGVPTTVEDDSHAVLRLFGLHEAPGPHFINRCRFSSEI